MSQPSDGPKNSTAAAACDLACPCSLRSRHSGGGRPHFVLPLTTFRLRLAAARTPHLGCRSRPARLLMKQRVRNMPENYAVGERLKQLPCLHAFHSTCINSWLRQATTYPQCRMDNAKPTQSRRTAGCEQERWRSTR